MSSMAKGASLLSPHGITGALAIILMLFHAIWATVVFKGQERKSWRISTNLVLWYG